MGANTWFFIVIISPFLYGITNHIDKHLLENYFKGGGVGTLFLVSSLLSAIPIPFILWFDSGVMQVSLFHMGVLGLAGCLNALLIWCYLSALQDEEASVTVVFYQLVPVWGYALGYFILGETLTVMQLVSMSIVLLGICIISFEVDAENNFKFKWKTVAYMSGASFCWALSAVVFKAAALEENVTRSLFWEHIVMVVVGVVIFMTVRSYRRNFLEAMRENSLPILALNAVNESIYIGGNVIAAFVYVMAPVSLVLLVDSAQPVFVFLIGVFLTVFFPKVNSEKMRSRDLWQKITAIVITGIGTYMLLA